MSKSPVYLFSRLGKYLGISTATGDFFDLSKETYDKVFEWHTAVLASPHALTDYEALRLSRKIGLPDDVLDYFPLSTSPIDSSSDDAVMTDITLNLTSQCNLNCVYCWNDKGAYSDQSFQKKGNLSEDLCLRKEMMSPVTARKAVDFLLAHCRDEKNLVIDFYGGEPLLNIDVIRDVVQYCKEKEKERGVSFHYLLATNGTLLTEDVAGELLGLGVQIAVSIDGKKEIHDANRPFPDGRGSFDTISKNLTSISERLRKRLVGRTTVTPRCPDMISLYENLHSLGFERVELFESEDACHKITAERAEIFFNREEDYAELMHEYERLARHYVEESLQGKLNYSKTFFNRFFKLMQRVYYNNAVTGGCPAAKGQCAFSIEGDVYPCTAFLGIDVFKIGHVDRGLDQKAYDAFIADSDRRFRECQQCEVYALCRTTGSCLNMNYYFNADIAKPYEKACQLFKAKLELAVAALSILSEKIPDSVDDLFGNDPVGRRGNDLY
jgi:uncharacterized protein